MFDMKKANKIKKIEKNNMAFLEIKSEKGQVLNPTEVEAITKNKVEGLLPLTVKESGKSFKLIYNITGMKTLNQYLQETWLNKQLFGFLLQNILNMLKTLDANYFQFTSLLLTFGKVKVEPSSRRLYFIYVPIQYYNNEVSLKDFLLKIISVAKFEDGQDLSFVNEYIQILNTGVNFSVFDLEEYINNLTNDSSKTKKTKKCPNCGKVLDVEANFCSVCRYSFIKQGVSGKIGGSVYDPLNDKDEEDFGSNYDFGWDIDNDGQYKSSEGLGTTDNIGTGVLGDDFDDDFEEDFGDDAEPTVVLNQAKKIVQVGFLTRISNNETKEIDQNDYVIGRSLKCEFSVPDNTAVGRKHAIISYDKDHFYFLDNNSTNRSYINGKVIPQDEKIEIYNNTKITLANEDFIFTIKGLER